MQEELLIIACKNGDPFAQRRLYDQYVKQIFLVTVRYVDDLPTAEEITADCFIKGFDKIGSFEYRGQGSFYAWLKKIAVNECIGFIRKRRVVYETEEKITDQVLAATNTALSKMHHDEIIKAIRMLPDGYRTVFNLYAIEGYSHAEIAKHLNISEEASRTQLYKARKALQKTVKR